MMVKVVNVSAGTTCELDESFTVTAQIYFMHTELEGGMWWCNLVNDGSPHCWYGDQLGPFDTPYDAAQALSGELQAYCENAATELDDDLKPVT